MARGRRLALGVATVGALALFGAGGAGAADGGAAPDASLPADGVACDSPIVQSFPSVWLGHFTGGYSHYLGEGGTIVLDWRNEKLCFPSNRDCNAYIRAMRQDFHRPPGYFTCLPLR